MADALSAGEGIAEIARMGIGGPEFVGVLVWDDVTEVATRLGMVMG